MESRFLVFLSYSVCSKVPGNFALQGPYIFSNKWGEAGRTKPTTTCCPAWASACYTQPRCQVSPGGKLGARKVAPSPGLRAPRCGLHRGSMVPIVMVPPIPFATGCSQFPGKTDLIRRGAGRKKKKPEISYMDAVRSQSALSGQWIVLKGKVVASCGGLGSPSVSPGETAEVTFWKKTWHE